MKNYEETVSTVFSRMAKYRKKQQKKNKIIMCTAIPLGCVCLIGALSFGLSKQSATPNQPQYIQATRPQIQEPVTEPSTPPATENTVIPNDNKIVIHAIDAVSSDRQDIALMIDDFVSMTKDQLNEYYGINVFPTVPSDIPEWEEQYYGIFKRNGGTGEVYHDVNVLNYDNKDFTRSVNIEMSKGNLPFSCCVFFDSFEENSLINGTEVAIGLSGNGYYYVEFMYQNVGFRMVALGVSEEELVDIISSIIQ